MVLGVSGGDIRHHFPGMDNSYFHLSSPDWVKNSKENYIVLGRMVSEGLPMSRCLGLSLGSLEVP